MRIAIIGTGAVGGALAKGLAGKGHDVVLGTRDPLSADSQTLARATRATAALPAEAARDAEIVILALPWGAAEAAIAGLGALSGVTVIDCMNPLGMVDGRLALVIGHDTSGGERVQAWLPAAHVVKTLNQVGAEVMAETSKLQGAPVMFMASDHAEAKMKAGKVLADLGFTALDAGDLTKSRLLEPLAMVWINQALARGKGRHWALGVIEARA